MAAKKSSKSKSSKKSKPAKGKTVKKKIVKKKPAKKAKKAAKPLKKAKKAVKKAVKKAPAKKAKAKVKPKKTLKKLAKKTAKKIAKLLVKKKNLKALPKPKIQAKAPAPKKAEKIESNEPEIIPVYINTPPVKKPAPIKRIKREPPPPAEPVEPLPKVIKTFSLKPEVKGAKNVPVHPNQYSIEYIVHASATLLFEVISSPSGLSEWFADDVNIRDGNFTFFWDGSTQVARQIAYKQDKLVRFQWEGKPDHTFFEFRIETDDLTNDTSLIITDFAEDGDKESARLLWDNQINRLRKSIGS